MKAFRRLFIFSVLFLAGFAWYGNFAIPQKATEPTQVIVIGSTPEELVSAGKLIWERENSCATCHSIGPDSKARCPDHKKTYIEAGAGKRKSGLTAVQYMVESVYDPNAFIVEGYPKNQMKAINRPPMSFSDEEIKAALCYIVSLSGEVTPEIVHEIEAAQAPYKTGKVVVAVTDEAAGINLPPGNAKEGRETFLTMRCLECHTVEGESGVEKADVGPDLTRIGAIQTREYLFESIMNPNAVIVKGEGYLGEDGKSKMPEFHDFMTLKQAIDIVEYLTTLKGGQSKPEKPAESKPLKEAKVDPHCELGRG